MVERKIILAAYPDLKTGQRVARALIQKGFQRKDVCLAVENTTRVQQKALVSVTTLNGLVDRAMEVIKRHRPLTFDKRDESSRNRDQSSTGWMFNPDQFSTVDLPEHDPRRPQFRAS